MGRTSRRDSIDQAAAAPVVDTGLVSVRFTTSRGGLSGCHVAGRVYRVPAEFGRLVVDTEKVAEYCDDEPSA